MYKHGILDPVHKWIAFNSIEKKIIDSPPFQRLRYIRQLTLDYMVYPEANHTRFSHSLGVMHMIGRFCNSLRDQYPHTPKLNDQWIQTLRLAGMLHDIAHGPFSHAYDDFVYKDVYPVKDGYSEKGHDEHRKYIIQQSPLKELIEEANVKTADLIDIWNGTDILGGGLLQGPLGADRMDFLLRDAYFTGTDGFGHIDYERIIHNTRLSGDQTSICYPSKILSQIQSFLIGRFWMYENVYNHKTVLACYVSLEKIFELIREPLRLIERTQNLDEFNLLTEEGLFSEALDKVPAARSLIVALRNRELPKLITPSTSPVETYRTVKTRNVETLEQSKMKKYNIKILDVTGIEHDAFDFIDRYGMIKNALLSKELKFTNV